jgi:hypothetical protein
LKEAASSSPLLVGPFISLRQRDMLGAQLSVELGKNEQDVSKKTATAT